MNIHEWVVKNIPKTGTIIEAGMYDGTDTKFFCGYFSRGKVYGFEPVPSLFNQAKQKVTNFGENNDATQKDSKSDDKIKEDETVPLITAENSGLDKDEQVQTNRNSKTKSKRKRRKSS